MTYFYLSIVIHEISFYRAWGTLSASIFGRKMIYAFSFFIFYFNQNLILFMFKVQKFSLTFLNYQSNDFHFLFYGFRKIKNLGQRTIFILLKNLNLLIQSSLKLTFIKYILPSVFLYSISVNFIKDNSIFQD